MAIIKEMMRKNKPMTASEARNTLKSAMKSGVTNKPMTAVSEKAMRVADKAFGRAEVRNMIQRELGSMGKARNTLKSAMKSGVTNKKEFAGVRKQYKSGKLSKDDARAYVAKIKQRKG